MCAASLSSASGSWPRTFLARKKPCSRPSTLYRHVPTLSTSAVLSSPVRRSAGPDRLQGGSECSAGKANQYVNLYFLRSAYERMTKEESREGTE